MPKQLTAGVGVSTIAVIRLKDANARALTGSTQAPITGGVQRLKPRGELLTTGDIARRCRVTTNAVKKWIRERNLLAFRTPGGHFRIFAKDFEAFAARHRMAGAATRPAWRRVLVVDDDPAVLRVVLDALSSPVLELIVASASDGYEALIAIGRFRPDVLILDLRMPKVDGLEVCRLLKSSPATREIAILVLTGYASPANVRRWREWKVDAILTKPVRLPDLVREVHALVARKEAAVPVSALEALQPPSKSSAG